MTTAQLPIHPILLVLKDGKDVAENACFEASTSGVTATVEGGTNTLVWDTEAPCGAGKVFVHSAGEGPFTPMTAGAGATLHTYKSAEFETLPIPTGTIGCYPFDDAGTVSPPTCTRTWRVARMGTRCVSDED